MHDDITEAIAGLTNRLYVYRVIYRITNGAMNMSLIEIKGLKDIVASAKKSIGEIRSSATQLNTETAGLKAEIDDLTNQVKQHRTDLRFEAETLGNSTSDTIKTDEKKVVE